MNETRNPSPKSGGEESDVGELPTSLDRLAAFMRCILTVPKSEVHSRQLEGEEGPRPTGSPKRPR